MNKINKLIVTLFNVLLITTIITISSYAWMQNETKTVNSVNVKYYYDHNLMIDDKILTYKLYYYDKGYYELSDDYLFSKIYPGKTISLKMEIINNSYYDLKFNLNLIDTRIKTDLDFLDYVSISYMEADNYKYDSININLTESDSVTSGEYTIYSYKMLQDVSINARVTKTLYLNIYINPLLPYNYSNFTMNFGKLNLVYYDF